VPKIGQGCLRSVIKRTRAGPNVPKTPLGCPKTALSPVHEDAEIGPVTHPGLDGDWRLRLAACARLKELAQRWGGVVTADDLDQGFDFEGERIRLWDARRGIWRPRQLGTDGAALTLVTAPLAPRKAPPYDDQVGSDAEWLLYRYEGTDPEHWTNLAVRRAYLERRPLIYLYGITPGLYEPIFPCTVVAHDPLEPGVSPDGGVGGIAA